MRRFIFLAFLALTDTAAMAEWVEISHDKGSIQYGDPATVRRDGALVKMWERIDYKKNQIVEGSRKSYRSGSAQWEYDCKDELARMLFGAIYSKDGSTVDTYEQTDWYPVLPDSKMQTAWKFACTHAMKK